MLIIWCYVGTVTDNLSAQKEIPSDERRGSKQMPETYGPEGARLGERGDYGVERQRISETEITRKTG